MISFWFAAANMLVFLPECSVLCPGKHFVPVHFSWLAECMCCMYACVCYLGVYVCLCVVCIICVHVYMCIMYKCVCACVWCVHMHVI